MSDFTIENLYIYRLNGADQLVDAYEQQQERIAKLETTLAELGLCPKCLKTPKHHLNEPFSTCDCGTGEDYATRPLQKLQKLEEELATTVERFKARLKMRDNLVLKLVDKLIDTIE